MVEFIRISRNFLRQSFQGKKWIKMSNFSSAQEQSPKATEQANAAQESEVILENKGTLGVITLNRPKALNALNISMIRAIYPKLKEWQTDKQMVMIKASSEKAFCAGGDIRAVTEAGKNKDPEALQFFNEEYHLNYLIGTLNVPYVALIHGITMGGGVGLSVHGKYRIATEKTVFAMPETAIGLFPDVGGSYFLPRLPGQIGTFLGLTGLRLFGQDVMKARVATHYCESDKVNDLEKEILAETDPKNVNGILDKYTKESLREKDKEFILLPHLTKINRLFAADSIEEILQNLDGDGSDWAKKQLESLQRMSPTSMKITLKLLRDGAKLSLKDCLKMEYRVVSRVLQDHDFYEGVRAALVDKDNNPRWNPSKLEEVTDLKILSFFDALPNDQELKL